MDGTGHYAHDIPLHSITLALSHFRAVVFAVEGVTLKSAGEPERYSNRVNIGR
jgi:hypothetical protein